MHYYLWVEGQKKGPLTLEELKENGLSTETLVWREGLPDWVKATELEELSAVLAGIPPCPPPGAQPEPKDAPPKRPACPKTWLAESILSACLCCLPLGIVGIVYAAKVDSAYLQGNDEMALRYSKLARNWTLAAAGSALLIAFLYMMFLIIMILLGNSQF